uniref:Dihydroceramide desaturase-1 n=1 Tax=Bursaphelenchus xylophilus TaxID=6326 RepID=A0A1I7SN91_BURXY
WVVGAVIDYNIFAVDNMFGKLAYCNATVPENQGRVRKMLTCLLPLELLITAGDIGLWWINRRDQKQTSCFRIYTDYSLSKSFQKSENYLTSRLVLPISLIHSAFYLVYLTLSSSFRSAYGYDSDPKAFMVGIMLVNGGNMGQYLNPSHLSHALMFPLNWKIKRRYKARAFYISSDFLAENPHFLSVGPLDKKCAILG